MIIQFKTRIKEYRFTDNTLARRYVKVPKLIMGIHYSRVDALKRFPDTANSDIFPAVLRSALVKQKVIKTSNRGGWIDIQLGEDTVTPPSVQVNENSFLATVTILI